MFSLTMIQVKELKKCFGSLRAVDGLSFSVSPGEVLGFLGPNGAGKSTTMKMLTGFLTPSSGEVTVFGINVTRNPMEAQKQIGYLPEGAPAYGDMSVLGFLKFIGEIRGFKGDELSARVDAVVRQVALQGVLHQRIETLSKGFKRRVGLAQAIIHDPQVLILDEPTDGLDPNQKHQVRELIKNLSKEKIVIVSTHILEEVHAVCTRAMIIAAGKLVADGKPEELAALSDYHQAITLRFTESCDAEPLLQGLPGVASVKVEEDRKTLTVYPEHGQSILKSVNLLIHEQDWGLEEFHVERGRLDDVFRKVTQEVTE